VDAGVIATTIALRSAYDDVVDQRQPGVRLVGFDRAAGERGGLGCGVAQSAWSVVVTS
jgi:hypothetical protein